MSPRIGVVGVDTTAPAAAAATAAKAAASPAAASAEPPAAAAALGRASAAMASGDRSPSIISTKSVTPGCSLVQMSADDVLLVGLKGHSSSADAGGSGGGGGEDKKAAAALATPPTMRDSDDGSLFLADDVGPFLELEETGKTDGPDKGKDSTVADDSSSSGGEKEADAKQLELLERQPSCLPTPKLLLARSPSVAGYVHARLPWERLEPYLWQCGGRSMAYGHLHKAQRHFEVPGVGVVSYCYAVSVVGHAAFVVGDPLAAPQHMPQLLERFHAAVPGMKLYCAVSRVVAEALMDQGMTATVFGNDYYGDFAHWKPPKSRRRYLNEGTRAGLSVEELRHEELTEEERARVQEISQRWLRRKKGFRGELQLMTYPFYMEDEWEVRKFYCFDKPRSQGGKLLAFIYFTPCFRDGQVAGWNANILRRDPTVERPTYVLDFLLLHCEKMFRAEQRYDFLALSFSPLHGLQPSEGDSAYLRRTFRFWYRLPSRLYSKKGLGEHKDHYKMNRVEKVYACAKGPRALLAIQDCILTCTNLVPLAKLRHGIQS